MKRDSWRPKDNTLSATPDHRGELDEIFLDSGHVHIERMANRCMWIGVNLKDGSRALIFTGVAKGRWYFNVTHDEIGGSRYAIEKPVSYKAPKLPKRAAAARWGKKG